MVVPPVASDSSFRNSNLFDASVNAGVTHTEVTLRTILILILLSVMGGCVSKLPTRLRYDSRDGMRAGVVKHAPVGTSRVGAIRLMEDAGFECEYVENGSFSEGRDNWLADIKYDKIENANFLKCTRSERSGLITGRFWTVAIVLDESDCVHDVMVDLYNDGP